MDSGGSTRRSAGRVGIGRRVVARLAAGLVLMVVLAGCKLEVTTDVTMAADGTGAVTVTALADGELLAKAPGALSDLRLDDVRTAGWTVDGPASDGLGGQRLTLRKPFADVAQANQVLAELSGPHGPLRQLQLTYARTFGQTRTSFAGNAALDGGIGAFGDDALVGALGGQAALANRVTGDPAEGFALTITASLPGRAVSNTGSGSNGGHTVTWIPDLHAGAATDLKASFSLSDDAAITARNTSRIARVMAVVWALAAIVALGGLVAMFSTRGRRRRRRPVR